MYNTSLHQKTSTLLSRLYRHKKLVQTSKLLKHQNIVVAADNDDEGIRAAKATGLAYAVPDEEGLDCRDVWTRDGDQAVREQLTNVRKLVHDKHSSTLHGFNFSTGSEFFGAAYASIGYI